VQRRNLPLPKIEAEALQGRDAAEALTWLKGRLQGDHRVSAAKLLEKFTRRVVQETRETARLERMLVPEGNAYSRGAKVVAGVDEAGRGPLAGPVVAAAVVLPEHPDLRILSGLNDSKQMTHEKREELFGLIHQTALGVGVGFAQAGEIDRINIREASRRAMERAVMKLVPHPDWLLIDAMTIEGFAFERQQAIIHGDALSLSIAAGSVVAKVTRDRLMVEMDAKFPGYGFAKHKGYGTVEHLGALRRLGPCPEHRNSFEPVTQLKLGEF